MTKGKYKTYKKSDIPWLGDIPEHWEIRRIKYVFKEFNSRSESGNEDLLSVSQYTGVTKKSDKVTVGENISNAKTLEGYKLVERGDLVINIMLAWNGSLGISPFNGITSPAYSVYRLIEGNEKYFGYLFRTPNAKQEFKKQSTGIIDSRLRMYTDSFFDVKTALPPIEEQTAIVNFLDYKLEKINRFIKKKKQLISLLTEQKAAIINQAVTKGINPSVKLIPSGIEWLGEIPEHWQLNKLKYISSKIGDGIHTTPTYNIKGEIPFINGNNLTNNQIEITEKTNTVDFDEFQKHKKELKNGTILISINGTIGNLAIYRGEKVVLGKSAAFIELIDTSYNQFLLYNLRTKYINEYFISTFQGTTINNLSLKAIRNTSVIIPPKKEQDEIVQYILTETDKVDKTISTIEKEIELVEEYKTALIVEAVTGKIDVRDFKLPRTEELLAMVAEESTDYKIKSN